MVKYQDDWLDRIFSALSDRTRRGLLARMSAGKSLSVSELAQPLDISLPAVMKHLDVLAGAGLVKRNKTGRTVACAMDATPMKQAQEWLERHQRFWTESFDRLSALLENDPWQPQPKPLPAKSSQASPSSAASRRRPRKSSRRGPTRRS
jgi:DNA-binding transcriptional ArsR family regulator